MEAMTRRRLLCGLLLLSAVLACLAGWPWIANADQPTLARFEHVKKDMARQQVIRTAGGPPVVPRVGEYETWVCDDGTLRVRFDDSDRAVEVLLVDRNLLGLPPPRPPTLTERIRRWLGL